VASKHGTVSRGASVYRILVIEDELAIRMALRRYFGRLGWAVDEAATGDDGYAMIRLDSRQTEQSHYAIIFSDLRMPGLSGIEMYERLKLTNPEVLPRVIFSTGDVTSEEVALFMKTTDCVILQKPFELVTLRAMIELMVQRAPA
jgi:DNA-binding response OmpR family regulator